MEVAQRILGDQLPVVIPSVVKVDYEKGIRKPLTKWSKVDRSLMHEYGWKQRMIDALTEEKDDGCIQVKLGPQSFHLCVLDVDADELVELVLEAMPVLGETLQTRGSKGRHFWFYLVGDYPKHKKQIICQGFTIEFLTEHSLCTIHGTHYKTGEPYQVINEATPITLKFEDIKPPADGEWKAKASNNGAGTKFSRSHMHGTASKHGGYDWKSYDAAIAAQDGLVDILVDEYFGDAIRIDGVWRCGDITGRTGRGRGSFVIEPNGRCTEYDDDSSCSIMQAITSDERDEKNTYEDVFAFIEKEAGLNLFMPPANKEVVLPQKGQKLKGEFATDVANVLQNDEFWFTTAAKIVTRIDRSIETWVNDEGVEVEGRERLRLVAVSASEAESTLEEKVN